MNPLKSLLAAILLTAPVFAADPMPVDRGPEDTVRVFLAELRRHDVTGLPDEKAWDALESYFSKPLLTLLEAARKEQLDYMKKFPDEKPPFIEGDLFSSLFEGPHRFQVGAAEIQGEQAGIPVLYERTESGDTVKWTDTFILTKAPDGWKVDDVRYGGTWDFSNRGTLKEALAPEQP